MNFRFPVRLTSSTISTFIFAFGFAGNAIADENSRPGRDPGDIGNPPELSEAPLEAPPQQEESWKKGEPDDYSDDEFMHGSDDEEIFDDEGEPLEEEETNQLDMNMRES
jgi:hypothetical protein